MSPFQDYISNSRNLKESGPSNDQVNLLKSSTERIIKRLKTKLKYLNVTTNGTEIVVGNDKMNNDPKLYAMLSTRGELRVYQSSHSEHTVQSLTKLSNMAKELADNNDFIIDNLRTAQALVDEILG